MGCGAWPNYTVWLQNAWGAGGETQSTWPGALFADATNLVFGVNPVYALDDFQAVYPKFFGAPTALSGAVTTAGGTVVAVPTMAGLLPGQFVQGAGLPKGSVITALGVSSVTLNQAATASGSITLLAYQSAPVPAAVVQLYLNLATASLVQARWQEQWTVAMGWFIAHYCTLYAKSDAAEVLQTLVQSTHVEQAAGAVPGTAYTLSSAPPGGVLVSLTVDGVFLQPGVGYTLAGLTVTLTAPTTDQAPWAAWAVQTAAYAQQGQASGAQIAAQGLAGGIQTSKSVGDVSVACQPLASLEDWGAWNLTTYGQQLATMARVVGAGPMCIW
jgi:hypothetical protein